MKSSEVRRAGDESKYVNAKKLVKEWTKFMIKFTPPKTHLPKTDHIEDPKPNFQISLPDPSLKSHQTTTTKTQKCYFPFLAGNQSDRLARATWVNHLLDGCNARMDIIFVVCYSIVFGAVFGCSNHSLLKHVTFFCFYIFFKKTSFYRRSSNCAQNQIQNLDKNGWTSN